MPRGRGRRRTVSQGSPPRVPRGRGRRQTPSAASRSPRVPLRRSVRLLNRSRMVREGDSIVDTVDSSSQGRLLGEHTGLSSRAARAEPSHQREHRRRGRDAEESNPGGGGTAQRHINGRTSSEAAHNSLPARGHEGEQDYREQRYEMEVVVQPPATARQGIRLYPPITVRLRIRDAHTDEEIEGQGQLGRLWALASVVEEDSRVEPRPPGTHILTGNLVDSAHPLYDDADSPVAGQESDETTVAAPYQNNALGSYLTFPGLVFNETGSFRIRITLIRMETSGRAAAAAQEGGLTLGEVQSRVIRIGDGLNSSEMGELPSLDPTRTVTHWVLGTDEQDFLESLRRRGIAVPSPPPSSP
ncbi:MAG: hypothetical protein M1840_005383 [Geoglossum simile]|nr:MAG: hypothetical protein M1840_005383 [Geoglossum simile]